MKPSNSNLVYGLNMASTSGVTENAGPENGGPSVLKGLQIQGQKMKDQISRLKNAGPETAGPGKCKTGI